MPFTHPARRPGARATGAICALALLAVLLSALAVLPPATPPAAAGALGAAAPALARALSAAPEPPPPRPEPPTALRELRTAEERAVEVFPPLAMPAQGAPMVVMLHGMCMDPLPVCDFWNAAGRQGTFLVCPAGNVKCGDAPDWGGSTAERVAAVDEGLEAVERAFAPFLDRASGDVLIGYSRGGFLARDVIYARPGRYRGVIFLGAAVRPEAARFRAAGVRRVVLAAGDYDGARPTMRRAAAELTAGGVEARFVTLGPMGHGLPDDLERILRDAIQWVRAAPESGS